MDLHSYHTAATTLAAGAHTLVDNDEELESPGPSPSSFPAPPTYTNPFNDARIVGFRDFTASRASQSSNAMLASSEDAALAPEKIRTSPEQQASWVAAVAAASPLDVQTPTAARSLNHPAEDVYVVDTSNDSSNQAITTPTQSHPPSTPFSDSSFIVNPFLVETSQEGFSDDSGSIESRETVSIPYAYSDPFELMDKGKGKAHLSVILVDDTRRNRLSDASSGLEFPDSSVSNIRGFRELCH